MYVNRYFSLHSRPKVWNVSLNVVCRALRLTFVRHQASLVVSGPQCREDETMLLPPWE